MNKKITILLLAPALLLTGCNQSGDSRSQIEIALESNKGSVLFTGSFTDKAEYKSFVSQANNYTKVYKADIGFTGDATTTQLTPYLAEGNLDEENASIESYFKTEDGLLAKQIVNPTNVVELETIKDFDGKTQLWSETRSNPFSLLSLSDYKVSSSNSYLFTLERNKANIFASHLIGETVTGAQVSFSVSTSSNITVSVSSAKATSYVFNPSSASYSEVLHTYSAILDVKFEIPEIYNLEPLTVKQELNALETWFDSFNYNNFTMGFAESDSTEVTSAFFFREGKIYGQTMMYGMPEPFMLDIYFEENRDTGFMDSCWATLSETTEELVWIKTSDDPNEKDNLLVPHNKTYENLSCRADRVSSALFDVINAGTENEYYLSSGENAKYMSSYLLPGVFEAYTAVSGAVPEFLRNACSSVKIMPDSDGMWFTIEGFASQGGASLRASTRFKLFNIGTTEIPFTVDISKAIDFADFK